MTAPGSRARPQELLERIGERSGPPPDGELVDVVAGGPHVAELGRPQDDRPHPLTLERAHAWSISSTVAAPRAFRLAKLSSSKVPTLSSTLTLIVVLMPSPTLSVRSVAGARPTRSQVAVLDPVAADRHVHMPPDLRAERS